MPPVFAQPSPVSRFSSSGGGGDYGSYASLARALQDRYASDADRQLRAQLGFAGLEEQRAGRQDELQLQAAALAMRPALEQQRADNEINNWMIQRRFNQSDQQELARQETAVSELQDKLDKGEISQNEFYQMIGQVAPRVNYLQAKEQHTRVKAIEQQRTQEAELFQAKKKQIDILNSIQEGELNNQIDVHIPAGNNQELANHMARVYPELRSGTPEYNAKLKMEAAEMGLGYEFIKTKNGNVPLSTVKGLIGGRAGASAGTGAETGEAGTAGAGRKAGSPEEMAAKATEEFFKTRGTPYTKEEWASHYDFLHDKFSGKTAAGEKATQQEADLGAMQVKRDEIYKNPDMPLERKMYGMQLVSRLSQLMEARPTKGVQEQKRKVLEEYKKFKGEMAAVKAAKKTQPAETPPVDEEAKRLAAEYNRGDWVDRRFENLSDYLSAIGRVSRGDIQTPEFVGRGVSGLFDLLK